MDKYKVIVWIFMCGLVTLSLYDDIFSHSVDFAHHYALVSRIFDYGYHFPSQDPSLGEMNYYPRYTHALAAYIGIIFGSPVIGMQIVIFLSLFTIWGCLIYILHSLPIRAFQISIILFAVIFVVLHEFGFVVFGNEVVANFAFAQLFAQAIVLTLITIALFLEKNQSPKIFAYFILGSGALIVEGAHLLPAVELYGFLALLVLFDLFLRGSKEASKYIVSVVLLCLLGFLILKHPTYKAMSEIASNNGGLAITRINGIGQLLALVGSVLLLSCGLLFGWAILFSKKTQHNTLSIKYVSLLGISISLLCLSQVILLKFGHGSEYACYKYIFGLDVILLFDIILIPIVLLRKLWDLDLSPPVIDLKRSIFVDYLASPCLMLLVFFVLLYKAQSISVKDLYFLEQSARASKLPGIYLMPNKFNYAVIGKPGADSLFSYTISIGVFQAPRDQEMRSILEGNKLYSLSKAYQIFTSVGSDYDLIRCHERMFAKRYILEYASCISSELH
ncbi:MAG: hypothetical protein ACHQAX_07445 [Gammaproteobacteria bacterium]